MGIGSPYKWCLSKLFIKAAWNTNRINWHDLSFNSTLSELVSWTVYWEKKFVCALEITWRKWTYEKGDGFSPYSDVDKNIVILLFVFQVLHICNCEIFYFFLPDSRISHRACQEKQRALKRQKVQSITFFFQLVFFIELSVLL